MATDYRFPGIKVFIDRAIDAHREHFEADLDHVVLSHALANRQLSSIGNMLSQLPEVEDPTSHGARSTWESVANLREALCISLAAVDMAIEEVKEAVEPPEDSLIHLPRQGKARGRKGKKAKEPEADKEPEQQPPEADKEPEQQPPQPA